MGTGGLEKNEDDPTEALLPGRGPVEEVEAPADRRVFDDMHRGAGPEPPDDRPAEEDEPTEEWGVPPRSSLREHPALGLHLTVGDRVFLARAVRLISRWMRMVHAPVELSRIERELIIEATLHMDQTGMCFTKAVVWATTRQRPQGMPTAL